MAARNATRLLETIDGSVEWRARPDPEPGLTAMTVALTRCRLHTPAHPQTHPEKMQHTLCGDRPSDGPQASSDPKSSPGSPHRNARQARDNCATLRKGTP